VIAAVPRSGWHVAAVVEASPETPSARRLVLDVPTWPGNAAGQHLDVRLTAPDGYTATRSYSIASSGPGTRVVLAIDRLPGGEVSPFLVDEVRVGDEFEVHGPLGRFFVWHPIEPGERVTDASADGPRPVQLIAGGSGVVPLVAIAAAHGAAADPTPMRLLVSVRTPEDAFFDADLADLARASEAFRLDYAYTRRAPDGWTGHVGRLTREEVDAVVIPAADAPLVYVCGSTGFVERVASWLIELGHDARAIRTERFGGT